MSDSEDPLDAVDDGGDDLFGDEGSQDADSPRERVLDDDDLASDPDEDSDSRNRYYDDAAPPQETRDRTALSLAMYRHQIPNPKDGTVSSTKKRHPSRAQLY